MQALTPLHSAARSITRDVKALELIREVDGGRLLLLLHGNWRVLSDCQALCFADLLPLHQTEFLADLGGLMSLALSSRAAEAAESEWLVWLVLFASFDLSYPPIRVCL